MTLKHKVRINVSGRDKPLLEAAERKLPHRLLRWLFGDFSTVYLLSPGEDIESVEVHEVKGGDDEQETE